MAAARRETAQSASAGDRSTRFLGTAARLVNYVRILPVNFVWREVDVVDADGVAERRLAMVPLPRYGNVCKRQYEEGCEYPMVPLEARSRASHNAYFAQVHDAFQNIPESIAARWPTEEHLRKWSLVETGWFNESEIDCADEKGARLEECAYMYKR